MIIYTLFYIKIMFFNAKIIILSINKDYTYMFLIISMLRSSKTPTT